MNKSRRVSFFRLFVFVVISIAVVGYFVGLQSPMNPGERADLPGNRPALPRAIDTFVDDDQDVIRAPYYSELGQLHWGANKDWRTSLAMLPAPPKTFDPESVITITPEQKVLALEARAKNRAFNGAPPTIPHPIEQLGTISCNACHINGAKTESLRISKMSHQFLTNCTQCHVERLPQQTVPVVFRETAFVGLPAPTGGPRAYSGAPPQMPHATWMREDCLSCHGFTGHTGLQTTHPWRQNCQQCHTPALEREQARVDSAPRFLPPLRVKSDGEREH